MNRAEAWLLTLDNFWNLLVLWLDGQALRFQTWALILILPFITFNLGQMTYFLLASVSSFIIGHSQSLIGQVLVRTKWPMMQNVCLTPAHEIWATSIAAHSSILAWRIPWTEEPGGLQLWGHKELDMTEGLSMHVSSFSSWGRELVMLSCLGLQFRGREMS